MYHAATGQPRSGYMHILRVTPRAGGPAVVNQSLGENASRSWGIRTMTSSAYVLAVDIGTSRTAASTARITSAGTIDTARFALGRQADSAPSAVFVSHDGLLFGEAA